MIKLDNLLKNSNAKFQRRSLEEKNMKKQTKQKEKLNSETHSSASAANDCSTAPSDNGKIVIRRVWAMPNKWTFKISPIAELIKRYVGTGEGWIDPFAGENSPAEITNDIEGRGATYQMDGLEFLEYQLTNSAAGVLFDPPYSVEQCLRKYTPKFNGTAGRTEYWSRCKREIARIVLPGGYAITFGWDSSGVGRTKSFAIREILLICHGACHNDTIVTVSEKLSWQNELDFNTAQ